MINKQWFVRLNDFLIVFDLCLLFWTTKILGDLVESVLH